MPLIPDIVVAITRATQRGRIRTTAATDMAMAIRIELTDRITAGDTTVTARRTTVVPPLWSQAAAATAIVIASDGYSAREL